MPRKSGSVGAPGEQLPGATRPAKPPPSLTPRSRPAREAALTSLALPWLRWLAFGLR
jgi:hypothetical protein